MYRYAATVLLCAGIYTTIQFNYFDIVGGMADRLTYDTNLLAENIHSACLRTRACRTETETINRMRTIMNSHASDGALSDGMFALLGQLDTRVTVRSCTAKHVMHREWYTRKGFFMNLSGRVPELISFVELLNKKLKTVKCSEFTLSNRSSEDGKQDLSGLFEVAVAKVQKEM